MNEYDVMKYVIAKDVKLEEFIIHLKDIGFNPDNYTKKQIENMFEEFESLLANNYAYNMIYNEMLRSVVDKESN